MKLLHEGWTLQLHKFVKINAQNKSHGWSLLSVSTIIPRLVQNQDYWNLNLSVCLMCRKSGLVSTCKSSAMLFFHGMLQVCNRNGCFCLFLERCMYLHKYRLYVWCRYYVGIPLLKSTCKWCTSMYILAEWNLPWETIGMSDILFSAEGVTFQLNQPPPVFRDHISIVKPCGLSRQVLSCP